jgi:hypothetical protein
MDKEEILQLIKETIRTELDQLSADGKFVFRRNLEIENGNNIELGRRDGTKIGVSTDDKLSFYGVDPVDQPATITDPTGGAVIDNESRTAIGTIIDRLQELGLLA